jgi:hypothetical protein
MLGRLFKLLLLIGVSTALARALLNPGQRAALHRLFQTLAWALLASAAVLVTLSLTRVVVL